MSWLIPAIATVLVLQFRHTILHLAAQHFAIIILSGIILFRRANDLNSHRSPDGTLEQPIQNRFGEMVKLCLASYQDEPRFQRGDQIAGWEYMGNEADLSLHLWRKRTTTGKNAPLTWALVVRGTKLVQELVVDWHLLVDSTSGSTSFNNTADRTIDLARRFLSRNNVDFRHDITFTGHSLGASLAEILLHSLGSNYHKSQAVTFESPGQPARFRTHREMPIPLPSLITLNSTPNPINTLNRPAAGAGCFYACGNGAGFPLDWLIRPAWWVALRTADLVLSVVQAVQVNMRTHSLRHLEAHIYANTFQSSDPMTWPLYTGNACRLVYEKYSWIQGNNAYILPPALGVQRQPQGQQAQIHPGISTMPRIPRYENGLMNLIGMTQNRPHKVDTPAQLITFRDSLGPFDVVYALVGINGMGKSSVFKALLGLDIADTSVPIGTGTNTTPFPVVAHVGSVQIEGRQTRIYLLDLPGLGAAGAAQEGAPFMSNQPADMVNLISPVVGAIFYVEKDSAPRDHSVSFYTSLAQVAAMRNISIRVIFNTTLISAVDQDSGQAELTRRLTEGVISAPGRARVLPNFNPAKMVRCRAITGDTSGGVGSDVAALRKMWEEERLPENINRAGQNLFLQHRPRSAQNQASEAPGHMLIAGTGLSAAAGCGVTGFLTWLPGIAVWPGATGTVLATVETVGFICAGPVVITGVATVGVGYLGYQGVQRWYRPSET